MILDNDAMIKLCCYALAQDCVRVLNVSHGNLHALGATKFIVAKQIRRSKHIANKDAASIEFARLSDALVFLEPSDEEVELAAEFESRAQSQNLMLDSGESQMLAVLLRRSLSLMLTGDKRAIAAIEALLEKHPLSRREVIACFEQLMLTMLEVKSIEELRGYIAREPAVDKAVSICFSLTSSTVDVGQVRSALESYIRDLRSRAPSVLFPGGVLSVRP